MCHKCFYTVLDGTPVHINGDMEKMSSEEMEALKQLVKVAKNYKFMKEVESKNKTDNEEPKTN